MAVRNHEVADKIVALSSLKVWTDLWNGQIYSCYWNANVVWRRWRKKKQLYLYMKRRCSYQSELWVVCLALNGNYFVKCGWWMSGWMKVTFQLLQHVLKVWLVLSKTLVCSCRILVRRDSFSLRFLSCFSLLYFLFGAGTMTYFLNYIYRHANKLPSVTTPRFFFSFTWISF